MRLGHGGYSVSLYLWGRREWDSHFGEKSVLSPLNNRVAGQEGEPSGIVHCWGLSGEHLFLHVNRSLFCTVSLLVLFLLLFVLLFHCCFPFLSQHIISNFCTSNSSLQPSTVGSWGGGWEGRGEGASRMVLFGILNWGIPFLNHDKRKRNSDLVVTFQSPIINMLILKWSLSQICCSQIS